ncbi:MAG: hypothetical protein JWL60_703 [Gemmatimonadetes bacterium]|jgi:hypothetical protein|nr:hypothetical protein [Gemmatimonadota bacterium]
MMRARTIASAAMAIALSASAAASQDGPAWRSVSYARQLRDTSPQRIRVQYGAGRVDVRGTAEPVLYALQLRYDQSRATPLHRYDSEQRSALLGLESRGSGLRDSRRRGDTGELRLGLPRRVPLDLDLEFGGAAATLELGGLMLQSLRLECGATDATLDFASPNRSRMREMEINVGVAQFTALHLANANADQIRVRGGAGSVDLDFGGVWTRDLAVTTRLAVGTLTLHVPEEVGVRLEVQRVAADFDHPGLVKRDDAWYSANWEQAPRKLRIRAETFFGKIELQRGVR